MTRRAQTRAPRDPRQFQRAEAIVIEFTSRQNPWDRRCAPGGRGRTCRPLGFLYFRERHCRAGGLAAGSLRATSAGMPTLAGSRPVAPIANRCAGYQPAPQGRGSGQGRRGPGMPARGNSPPFPVKNPLGQRLIWDMVGCPLAPRDVPGPDSTKVFRTAAAGASYHPGKHLQRRI